MTLTRRGFLSALAGLAAAPAIVRAESLMRLARPASYRLEGGVLVPSGPLYAQLVDPYGRYVLEPKPVALRQYEGVLGIAILEGIVFHVSEACEVASMEIVDRYGHAQRPRIRFQQRRVHVMPSDTLSVLGTLPFPWPQSPTT